MKKPINIIKNNALGIVVVAFAILLLASAGYAIYFAINRLPEINQTKNQIADVETEDASEDLTIDSFGFSTTPGNGSSQVLGESIDEDFSGFSNARHADPEMQNEQKTKGGLTVKPSVQGITTTAVVSNETKPRKDTDIEVEVSKYPEIERDDEDITYIYTVEFNSAAKEAADYFDYYFDGKSCENFEGKTDLESTTNIYVKINRGYLDNYNEIEKSDYKIEVDGEEFRGTVYVPICN